MRAPLIKRLTLVLLLLASFGTAVACGGGSSAETEDEPLTEDELRQRSVDLFKPTWAPIQIVPSTLKGLVHWEVYVAKKGITVIGRSKTKKAKAIFVQLLNGDTAPNMLAMQGSGYLVASDFRLDARSKSNELKLLAAAIRKDLSASINEPEPSVQNVEPYPVGLVEDGGSLPPIEEAPEAGTELVPVEAPEAGVTDAGVNTSCARSAIKVLLFGLRYVADATLVVVGGVSCTVTEAGCISGAAAFQDAVNLHTRFDELTCR